LSHQTASGIRSTEKNFLPSLIRRRARSEPPGTGFFGVETGHRKGPRALPETRRRKIDDKKGRQPRPEVNSLQKSSDRTTAWWVGQGPNLGPLPGQGSALPLRYAPIKRDGLSAPPR